MSDCDVNNVTWTLVFFPRDSGESVLQCSQTWTMTWRRTSCEWAVFEQCLHLHHSCHSNMCSNFGVFSSVLTKSFKNCWRCELICWFELTFCVCVFDFTRGIPTVPGTVTLKKDVNNLIGISIGGGAQYCPCLYIVQVGTETILPM